MSAAVSSLVSRCWCHCNRSCHVVTEFVLVGNKDEHSDDTTTTITMTRHIVVVVVVVVVESAGVES